MLEPFDGSESLSEIANALFTMPSIADAALIYGLGWTLVLVPFLVGWGAKTIAKAVNLIAEGD